MPNLTRENEAHERLRPLIEEGLVTGIIWAREGGEPMLLIGANVQTDGRAPDFDLTRFVDAKRRIEAACRDLRWRFSPNPSRKPTASSQPRAR